MLVATAISVLLAAQPAPADPALAEFSPVLTPAEWRLWMSEVAPTAAPAGDGRGGSDRTASQERLSRGEGLLSRTEPGIAGQAAFELPEYSIWAMGQRECWFTSKATLRLRRLADGSYAAIVVADQAGRSVVLGCGASTSSGRIVFDRWVPWGPCREAIVRVDADGVTTFEPLVVRAAEAESSGITIPGGRMIAPPRVVPGPGVMTPAEWSDWTEQALRSMLKGISADKQARVIDGAFVFGRIDGLCWYVEDPRLQREAVRGVASAALAVEQQQRRLAQRAGPGKVALALPMPPAQGTNFDGEWIDAGESGHRLHVRTRPGGKLALLESQDRAAQHGRVAQQLSASYKHGCLAIKDGATTSGVERLVPAVVGDEVVLVNDSVATLSAWNEKPEQRLSTPGVWRRKRIAEPPTPRDELSGTGEPATR